MLCNNIITKHSILDVAAALDPSLIWTVQRLLCRAFFIYFLFTKSKNFEFRKYSPIIYWYNGSAIVLRALSYNGHRVITVNIGSPTITLSSTFYLFCVHEFTNFFWSIYKEHPLDWLLLLSCLLIVSIRNFKIFNDILFSIFVVIVVLWILL